MLGGMAVARSASAQNTPKCNDSTSCQALFSGPGCNPPATLASGPQPGDSFTYDQVITLTGQPESVILPIIECLSGYSLSTDVCLTYDAFVLDMQAGDPCHVAASPQSSACSDGTCGSGENYNNCPADCQGYCGDGTCDPTETSCSCPSECGGYIETVIPLLPGYAAGPSRQMKCDSSACYYVAASTGGTAGINRVDFASGAVSTFVASGLYPFAHLTLTDNSVCWFGGPGIRCATKAAGLGSTITFGNSSPGLENGLMSDGSLLYYAMGNSIYAVSPTDGATPYLVKDGLSGPADLVYALSSTPGDPDRSWLYFTQGSPANRISRVPTAGGDPQDLITDSISQFDTNGAALCWTVGFAHSVSCGTIDPVSATVASIHGVMDDQAPSKLTVFGPYVYTQGGNATTTTVVMAPTAGTTGTTLVALFRNSVDGAMKINVFDPFTYFTDSLSLYRVIDPGHRLAQGPQVQVTAPTTAGNFLPGQSLWLPFYLGLDATQQSTPVQFTVTDAAGNAPSAWPYLSSGVTTSVPTLAAAPPVAPKDPNELDFNYLTRLQNSDNTSLTFSWAWDWNDGYCSSAPHTGSVSGTEVLPILQTFLGGTATAAVGDVITYYLQVYNIGHAIATGAVIDVVLPDGTKQALSLPVLVPGDSYLTSYTYTVPAGDGSLLIKAHSSTRWSDENQTFYGPVIITSETSVAPCTSTQCQARPCTAGWLCSTVTNCVDGLCVPNVGCEKDSECASGSACVDNVCNPAPSLASCDGFNVSAAPAGAVLTNPGIRHLYWGSYWSSAQGVLDFGAQDRAWKFISSSPEFYQPLHQYSLSGQQIGTGYWLGSAGGIGNNRSALNPRVRGRLTDSQIKTELQAEAQAKGWNTSTAESIYVIYLPPGVQAAANYGASCDATTPCTTGTCDSQADECLLTNGYHGSAVDANGHPYRYVVVQFSPNTDGSLDSQAANLTESREVDDAITDPDGTTGWSGTASGARAEVDDSCVGHSAFNDATGTPPGPYLISRVWSQVDCACISKKSPQAPPPSVQVSRTQPGPSLVVLTGTNTAILYGSFDLQTGAVLTVVDPPSLTAVVGAHLSGLQPPDGGSFPTTGVELTLSGPATEIASAFDSSDIAAAQVGSTWLLLNPGFPSISSTPSWPADVDPENAAAVYAQRNPQCSSVSCLHGSVPAAAGSPAAGDPNWNFSVYGLGNNCVMVSACRDSCEPGADYQMVTCFTGDLLASSPTVTGDVSYSRPSAQGVPRFPTTSISATFNLSQSAGSVIARGASGGVVTASWTVANRAPVESSISATGNAATVDGSRITEFDVWMTRQMLTVLNTTDVSLVYNTKLANCMFLAGYLAAATGLVYVAGAQVYAAQTIIWPAIVPPVISTTSKLLLGFSLLNMAVYATNLTYSCLGGYCDDGKFRDLDEHCCGLPGQTQVTEGDCACSSGGGNSGGKNWCPPTPANCDACFPEFGCCPAGNTGALKCCDPSTAIWGCYTACGGFWWAAPQ